ncbi:MAG TPA: oligosaccharide flippase family protein [Candidatus Dormibacteraeota bacterium]|nr:oligosaccharide flippase family protein [Candidatus Dormibacteraeota bacterium]
MSRFRLLVSRLAGDRLVRNNAIFFSGTVVAGALSYGYHFLTARLLGPAAYSAVASAVAALYILILPAPVMQTVAARFASQAAGRNDVGQIRQVMVRVGVVSFALGIAIAISLAILAPKVAGYLQISDRKIAYVLAVATVAGILVAANRGVLQGLQRFVVLSLNVLLDNAVRVASALAAIAAGGGPFGAVSAVVAGPAVAWAQSAWLLNRQRRVAAEANVTYGELGRYAVSAAIGVMGITFLFNADVLLTKHYLAPSSAGIYAAGAVLARVVYFLGLTVTAVMFPEVASLHARDQAHFRVVDLSLLFMAAVSVVFVAVYGLVPGLVLFPLGPGFAATRPLLGLFALALSLLTIANLLVNYFLSVNSLRFMVPLVGSCILEVALISIFHASAYQILQVVAISMAALAMAMVGLYAADRVATRRVRTSAPAESRTGSAAHTSR